MKHSVWRKLCAKVNRLQKRWNAETAKIEEREIRALAHKTTMLELRYGRIIANNRAKM